MNTLAPYIDYTLLHPTATQSEIEKLCREALEHRFKAVCVNPVWVRWACECLHGSEVLVCSVVGFPLGALTVEMKCVEAKCVIAEGAQEVDMVCQIGALKSGDLQGFSREITSVVEVVHGEGAVCKVILETGHLAGEEKVKACEAVVEAGADFVKTSTGFGPGGATVEDVRLLKSIVGNRIGVKASGGIRTRAAAEEMIQAGASRIGTSSGVEILLGKASSEKSY